MAFPPDDPRHSQDERLRALLAELRSVRETQERIEFELVHLANDLGMSWDRIGEAHDPPVSRQAVRKRYSHPKPRRRAGGG